jgi:hypothetical protein
VIVHDPCKIFIGIYIYNSMSSWLDSSDNANCFKQTYVQGFVDISGGNIITRGPNDGIVIGGDSSLNGTVYLGDSMFVRSNGIFPGTADNGATPVYVDASYADVSGGAFIGDVVSYDISGGPTVEGSTVLSTFLQSDASWSQLGFDIDGELAGDESGQSVSLINSKTYGRVVAIGAPGNGGNAGHVRVYKYDANKTTPQPDQTLANFGPVGWNRLGADIDGEAIDLYKAQSVSLVDASGGLVVAIGTSNNDAGNATTDNRGHVRVYQYSSTKTSPQTNQTLANFGPVGWNRLGADIDGEAGSDYSGNSVSLVDASGGLVVAIGANGNDGTVASSNAGHVRVYQYSSTKTSPQTNQGQPNYGPVGWNRLGADIDGEAAFDYSGRPVSLVDSADGLVVAIGANGNDGTNAGNTSYLSDDRGHVRVYQYTNSSWSKLGGDIDGESGADGSGWSVSLVDASGGLVVAIGAYLNDGMVASSNRGHVRVYQYDATKNEAIITDASANYGPIGWNRLGADIDGEANNDQSGGSVSLVDSSIGLVVAIGAKQNDGSPFAENRGHVRVYQYVAGKAAETSQSSPNYGPIGWRRLGADIDGEAELDSSGQSVSLVDSADGLVVAIGATNNDAGNATSDNRGHVRVYEIPYTKVYSDVSGGFLDVQVIGGYLNDGKTTAALYVNGDTDLSGGLTVSGDVSFNAGNLFVAGDLSLNGNLFINSFAANSINADAIDSTVDIEFANKLSVSTSDLDFNATTLQVATNFNSNNTLINLATNLTVPANIAIVDGSNGTVYGSYLTLTNKDATAYYNVGKSASGLFNIVDQANAGVYLASGGTSFTGTSDARLKTNITPLESATDKIMALNPCTYQWKSDVESAADNAKTTKTHIGFIAQEVEKVMPELVHPIDHPAGSDYKGVNTTDLIPYLVRTIQEQTATMNALESRFEALKQSRLARK